MDASSEKVTNYIPDNVAFSILSRLSIKSLKRFGCAHKSWSLLFENPQFMITFGNNFISKHHSYYDDTSFFLHLYLSSDIPPFYSTSLHALIGERFENRIKLDWPNQLQDENFVGFHTFGSSSINGIFCLYLLQSEVVLWNPATEEFKVLPSSSVESLPPYRNTYISLLGYGYDPSRDDYKVIRHVVFFPFEVHDAIHFDVPWDDVVPYLDHYDPPIWEIYSLKTNSWKILDLDIPNLISCNTMSGAHFYMDGMCHWWDQDYKEEAYLVSFDLSSEVFFTTPIPLDINIDMDDNFDFRSVRRHLAVLNGSIASISFYKDTTTFHISVLDEIGVKESWTKLFVIGPLSCVEEPIGVGKNGVIFFRKKDDELVWYDLSTQIIEELGIKGSAQWCRTLIYKENLLSIGGISS